MNIREKIEVFERLGDRIRNLRYEEIEQLAEKAFISNRWFTPESTRKALEGISYMLEGQKLQKWTSKYALDTGSPVDVGIIMAGNIPLVGFHDLLCVLLSSHRAIVKMSSQDQPLTMWVIEEIGIISPEMAQRIVVKEKLSDIHAVIATGSDNSGRYFEYYFGKYPNIIRKNRTSIAILTGNETPEQLINLGQDVFSYFGMGCRNVSKLLVPKGYDFKTLLDIWQSFSVLLDHHKYKNNYDYHKSILLVNREPHLDSGFSLLRESDQLVSPLSVIYYEYYHDADDLDQLLKKYEIKLQCVIGSQSFKAVVDFGQAQSPEPWDYADNVDTLAFLCSLSQTHHEN